MKILLTGASGFLGTAVVRQLVRDGYSTRCLLRKTARRDLIEGLDMEIVEGDVIDPESVDRAVSGCNIVMHLASAYQLYPWWERKAAALYAVNVEGTKNILKSAFKHSVERFIFTSSIAALAKDTSHYARSKQLAEKEVLRYIGKGLPAIILRPAIIFGEGDYHPTPSGEVIIKFLNRAYPGYFESVWSVCDVNDAARAHIAAITRGRAGERYILCNKKHYTMKEIFDTLQDVSGVRAPRIKFPYSLLMAFVYIDETISYFMPKKKPLMLSEGARFCRASLVLDNSMAVRDLDYRETPFRETLSRAIRWYRDNGYIK